MKKALVCLLCVLLILFGVGLYCYPAISSWQLSRQTEQTIAEFEQLYETKRVQPISAAAAGTADTEGSDPGKGKENDPLYQTITAYNRSLYETNQVDFKDAWSYEQSPISLNGLESENFGYIEIPSMDVKLSLYIGASTANMAKGAAVMGQTSIPIGGENTNSVIAGHRGYRGTLFFREIEKVSLGDYVYITNPWETLAYRVESIDIIDPYDSDAVKIQDGRDMVTLITCHPYASHGKYRYVVYCTRDEEAVEAKNAADPAEAASPAPAAPGDTGYIAASDGQVYEASEKEIQSEDLLRKGSGLAIILLVLFTLIYVRKKGRC